MHATGETIQLTTQGRIKCAASISALFCLLGVLVGVVVYAYPHIVAPVIDTPTPVTVVPAPLHAPAAPAAPAPLVSA